LSVLLESKRTKALIQSTKNAGSPNAGALGANAPYAIALRSLIEKHGPDKATLQAHSRNSKPQEWLFEIQSRNPGTAPLSILVFGNGDALLCAGFTQTEVWTKHGYGDPQQISDIVEMCEAVLCGRFEEVVISSGEFTLYTSGTFHLKGRPLKSTRTQMNWRWLKKKSRSIHRYEPYT